MQHTAASPARRKLLGIHHQFVLVHVKKESLADYTSGYKNWGTNLEKHDHWTSSDFFIWLGVAILKPLRLLSNDCSFLRQHAVNRHLAHRGYTFRSCGTLGPALLEVAVCHVKSTAGIISICTHQYDSYIFSTGWLEQWSMRFEVHPARIRPTWHAVIWRAASYLYKIVNIN